jgi:outer membrane protein assembly factor BamB
MDIGKIPGIEGKSPLSKPRAQKKEQKLKNISDSFSKQGGTEPAVDLQKLQEILSTKTKPEDFLVWEFKADNRIICSPTLHDGVLYVGSDDKSLHAVDAATGVKKWSFPTGSKVQTKPAMGPGNLLFTGSDDGNLYALDRLTGEKKWEYPVGSMAVSSPAASPDGSTVYHGSRSGHLYAFDSSSGAINWCFDVETGRTGKEAPPCSGVSFSERWEYEQRSPRAATPAVAPDGTVYMGCSKGILYALDGMRGKKKWELDTARMVTGGVAFSGDAATLYAATTGGALLAIDAQRGKALWSFQAQGSIEVPPFVGPDGTIYTGSDDRCVYALDPATGREKWHFATDGAVRSTPVLDRDGVLYVGSFDTKLYALDSKTGEKLWEYETGGRLESSPALGPGDTVYIGCEDGGLYALRSNIKQIVQQLQEMEHMAPARNTLEEMESFIEIDGFRMPKRMNKLHQALMST